MTSKNETIGPQFNPERLKPALQFIESYWKKLERFNPHDDGTLVGLPRPYFVPSIDSGSGHHFEEIYYWDSYFTAQGFIGSNREYLIKGLVEDLMALMDRFHIIPNSGRTYHTSHSQPPFLTSFIFMVYDIDRSKRWLAQAMSVAKQEYRTVWLGSGQPNWRQVFHGLSRYYDINVLDDLAECESGWDMNTRFNRQALSYIPVDLNALLYKYEKDFERASHILGDDEEANEWSKRALARKNAMREYLWNEEQGFYFDYNFMTGKQSPVWSMAAFFPMWAGMDDNDTVARIMKHLDKFEYEGGLVTATKEPVVKMAMPAQWDYPNGWAPLQLIAVEGMEKYGYHNDAERVARKWLNANMTIFENAGVFQEKYNVVEISQPPKEGLYPSHTGFGWTNAVFVRLCEKYLRSEEMPHLELAAAPSPLKQLVRDPRKTLRRVGVKINAAVPRKTT